MSDNKPSLNLSASITWGILAYPRWPTCSHYPLWVVGDLCSWQSFRNSLARAATIWKIARLLCWRQKKELWWVSHQQLKKWLVMSTYHLSLARTSHLTHIPQGARKCSPTLWMRDRKNSFSAFLIYFILFLCNKEPKLFLLQIILNVDLSYFFLYFFFMIIFRQNSFSMNIT